MFGDCLGLSTDYKQIKRRLENLTRELKGLGSKQLTTREVTRFRNRYKDIINIAEHYCNYDKLSQKEKKKLSEKIDTFRINFQHLGFFEMEPSTRSVGSDLPEKQRQGKSLRSHKEKESDVDGDEEHKKHGSSEPTFSKNQYLAIKTHLESMVQYLKKADSLHMEVHLLQCTSDFRDINSDKNLSNEQKKELLLLWKEYKNCVETIEKNDKEKEQKRTGIRGAQPHGDSCRTYSMPSYGSSKNCCADSVKSNYYDVEMGETASSNVNRCTNEVKEQNDHQLKSKENNELPHVHSSIYKVETSNRQWNETHFGYSPKKTGSFFEEERSKRDEQMNNQTLSLSDSAEGSHEGIKQTEHSVHSDRQDNMMFFEQKHSTDNINKNTLSETTQEKTEFTSQGYTFSEINRNAAERILRSARFPQNEEELYEQEQKSDSRQDSSNEFWAFEKKELKSTVHNQDENMMQRNDNRGNSTLEGVHIKNFSKEMGSQRSSETLIPIKDHEMVSPHFRNNISPSNSNRSDHWGRGYRRFHEQETTNTCQNFSNPSIDRTVIYKDTDEQCNKPNSFADSNRSSYNRFQDTPKYQYLDRNCHVHEIAEEAKEEEPLQILDVHQYFRDDFDLNSVDSLDFDKRIDAINTYAKTFEPKVSSFDDEKYSLEYFVLDEKLMRLIEKLDKMKCQESPGLTNKKIAVIEYIKSLHSVLDKRAKE